MIYLNFLFGPLEFWSKFALVSVQVVLVAKLDDKARQVNQIVLSVLVRGRPFIIIITSIIISILFLNWRSTAIAHSTCYQKLFIGTIEKKS